MIITCPNCETRYEVAEKAIGSAGRKVQCANCHQSWQAVPEHEPKRPRPKLVETDTPKPGEPEDDRLFSPEDEDALDEVFSAEADKAAPQRPAEKPMVDDDGTGAYGQKAAQAELDSALKAKRRQDFIKRKIAFAKEMPMSKIRANARLAGLCLLALVLVGGVMYRTNVVRIFPELAGVYAAIGLPVNVVGLEFDNVETIKALKNGSEVMIVSGRILNITGRQANVPPIEVFLIDDQEQPLYSWSVTPVVRSMGPGEIVEFETQLNSAPDGARKVKLVFAEGRAN